MIPCPKCINGKLIRDFDGNSGCPYWGYEYVATVSVGQNSSQWSKRTSPPKLQDKEFNN